MLRNGSICLAASVETCVAVRPGPLCQTTQMLMVVISSLNFLFIFVMTDKKMPRTTFATGIARISIVLFFSACSLCALVGVASLHSMSYIFVSSSRIDVMIGAVFITITLYFLAFFDVLVYNSKQEVVEARAARVRAAKAAGEIPKPVPSPFSIALKKVSTAWPIVFFSCIYATLVPMAFEAAVTEMEKLAVYCIALVVCKTGGEHLLHLVFEKHNLPFHSLVIGLFAFELFTSTQARMLLASYPDTTFVAFISLLSAFYELAVRGVRLFKVRFELADLESRGLDDKKRKLFMRKARIYAVVGKEGRDTGRRRHRGNERERGRVGEWATH